MRAPAPRSEGGFSLLEMIVVLALVSTVVVALASGLTTSATSANAAKDRQRLGFAMTSVTETLRQLPYHEDKAVGCSPASDMATYEAAYAALPAEQRSATAGMNPVDVIDIDYWVPMTFPTSTTVADQWGATCSTQAGAQRLTIRLSLPSNTGGRSLVGQVVLRKGG